MNTHQIIARIDAIIGDNSKPCDCTENQFCEQCNPFSDFNELKDDLRKLVKELSDYERKRQTEKVCEREHS